ncbi:hypothetical protein L9F63_004613, partial [Diploptera punctata]
CKRHLHINRHTILSLESVQQRACLTGTHIMFALTSSLHVFTGNSGQSPTNVIVAAIKTWTTGIESPY